jgi:hypothetical protein
MFERVLGPQTRYSLERLASWISRRGFYLAGGTGCALHLGHRMSLDLDFFTATSISAGEIGNELGKLGNRILDYSDAGTWIGNFEGIKVGFYTYPYPLIGTESSFGPVSVASLEDIGCMKIEAISGRGRKRDFIDLYYILRETGFDLGTLWNLYRKKYSVESRNLIHTLKSLVYFVDADEDPDPMMLTDYSWIEIKRVLTDRIKTIAI